MVAHPKPNPESSLLRKNAELRAQLAEAQEILRAIQSGEVDAFVVKGPQGEQIFTLKSAEQTYRVLVETMNEGAATLAADGTMLYCNQRLADLVGIPLEQIIGSPAAQLVADDAKRAFEHLFTHALRGEAARSEVGLQAASGNRIPAYVSLREMKADGPTALCMVVTDLTERKRKDELIAAGRLANSILESTAEAIAVCDETGKIIIVNEALVNLCGFNPLFQPFDEALPLELIGKSGGPGNPFSALDALRGGTVRAQEGRLVRTTGPSVSFLLTAAPIMASSSVIGCVLTMTDITDRKHAEETLRESEARFRSVLDTSRDVIYRVNVQTGHYEYISPSAEAVVGFSPAELMAMDGEAGLAMIHPDDLPAMRAAMTRLEDTGEADLEYRQRTKNGEYRWMSNRMSLIKDSAGRPLYRNGNIRDITERKMAEEALFRSEKLASVGRVAAAIAHEINNPLGAVTNLLFIAKETEKLPESVRRHLEMADAELRRVAHITRQSLGFYRESTAPAPTPVSAVLESAVDLMKSRIEGKHARIEKERDDSAEVVAVAGELRQVFSNLLANSLDAIDEQGTIRLRVSTGTAGKDGQRYVRITVADNGKGIGADSRQHLFEPFFTTKGTVGTGLGLWVSKQIIDKHCGAIRMRTSTAGKYRGTTFSILLPMEPTAAVRSQSVAD